MVFTDVYAVPKMVTDISDCYFYHTMDVPGYGLQEGQWDLRATIDAYLGNSVFAGKRVLDVGTADGFIAFHVEQVGAEVVGLDLSENQIWDLVPFAGQDMTTYTLTSREHIRKLNNAYWLNHSAFNSRARMVYSTIYALPRGIGPVDISIVGSILLHLRDPFTALEKVAALTREMIIVAEPLGRDWITRLLRKVGMPYMQFVPCFKVGEPKDSWWYMPPITVCQFLGVLGFEKTRIIYHTQQYGAWKKFAREPYYTIVAQRTQSNVFTA